MSREWKPGDVALVSSWRGTDQIALRARPRVKDDPLPWCVLDQSGDTRGVSDSEVTSARPLVVIDPDSPKDQLRILSLLRNSGAFRGVVAEGIALDCIGDALREFANPTPPKPDEPTGLGAVVEDEDGERWLRWEIDARHPKPWTVAGSVKPNRAYSDIAAVKVLSKGVTA